MRDLCRTPVYIKSMVILELKVTNLSSWGLTKDRTLKEKATFRSALFRPSNTKLTYLLGSHTMLLLVDLCPPIRKAMFNCFYIHI